VASNPWLSLRCLVNSAQARHSCHTHCASQLRCLEEMATWEGRSFSLTQSIPCILCCCWCHLTILHHWAGSSSNASGLHLDWNIDYPDWRVSWFSQSLQTNSRIIHWNRSQSPVLLRPLYVIIFSYHSMLNNLWSIHWCCVSCGS